MQRLTRTLSGLFLGAAAAGSACVADAPPADREPSRAEESAVAALDHLAVTEQELGLDVLVGIQIYGDLAAEPRADAVARARLDDVRPTDRERYGFLLDLPKAPPARASLAGVPEPEGTPDPAADTGDDTSVACPLEALACELSPRCAAFLELDSWGYVLTHQALVLVFADWVGCALPGVDASALARRYAARLSAESRFDPQPGDLFYERLTMLAQLGYAAEIEPAWRELLLGSQRADGCFPLGPELPCHPHPTGLALWTLGHVIAAERALR